MSILQAAILGIIQGLAEFIPISSSGHLELARRLMGLTENDAVMTLLTVLLHAGTLIAIGQDRLSPDCIDEALETGNRLVLGITAPPQGLELTKIFYDLPGEEPPGDMR